MNLISKIRNFFLHAAFTYFISFIIYYCYVIIRLYYQLLLFLDFSVKIKEKSWYCKKEMVSLFLTIYARHVFFRFFREIVFSENNTYGKQNQTSPK